MKSDIRDFNLQRIGLFGGTFNPIHTGHLRIAAEIKEHFSLDGIIFIPTGIPPHKEDSEVIDPAHRLHMAELAVAPYQDFSVSPVEAERKGFSYSIDTVKAFQKELGDTAELYFILGIDAFLEIKTWKDTDEFLTLCHFIVIPRPGYRFIDLKGLEIPPLNRLESTELDKLDKGEIARLSMKLTGRYHLFLERITPCDISSTGLRVLIKEGREVKNLLPESVLLYIMEKGLYH